MLNLTPKIHQNSPVSIYHIKNFPGLAPGPPFKRQGKDGREGKGEQWRGGKERNWMGGKGRNIPKINATATALSAASFTCSLVVLSQVSRLHASSVN
jgi:hypothetical protein